MHYAHKLISVLMIAFPSLVHAAACVEPGVQAPIPAVKFVELIRGLKSPTDLVSAFDGSPRLFVLEQAGTVRVIDQQQLRKQAFLDLRSKVDYGGEKGLLGIAFHPQYKSNGYFFVNYTASIDEQLYTFVSRFSRRNASTADPASEVVLLKIEQPYANHNGGKIAFGPDGFLYIGMGDGGSANDPHGHGQNLKTLLGALLRIDVDTRAVGRNYGIPKHNPFVGKAFALPEIYAYGLRNPWRFSFDAAVSRLYLADAGQDEVEEINVIEKGGNYGWNIMEGDGCTSTVNPTCAKKGLKLPIQVYRHPEGFSVTGGFVYRGTAIPALCGVYLYADYVTKRLWGLRYDGARVPLNKLITTLPYSVSSFGEDQQRELYLLDHSGGKVIKIVSP